jgi:hypothetical protein
MLDPSLNLLEDYEYISIEQYLTWLRHHEGKSFSGQDIIRLFQRNLDALEKEYVIGYFREYFSDAVLSDMYRYDTFEGYESPFSELIGSTIDLCWNLFTDVVRFVSDGDMTLIGKGFWYYQEIYRLFIGWQQYYNRIYAILDEFHWAGGCCQENEVPWWYISDGSEAPWWGY